MIPRRAVGVAQFAGSVIGLLRYWRRHRDRKTSWWWVLVGGLFQVAYLSAYDRDVGAIRTQKTRSFGPAIAIGLGVTVLKYAFGDSARDDFALGVNLGTVIYRFKYGVLGPLPA